MNPAKHHCDRRKLDENKIRLFSNSFVQLFLLYVALCLKRNVLWRMLQKVLSLLLPVYFFFNPKVSFDFFFVLLFAVLFVCVLALFHCLFVHLSTFVFLLRSSFTIQISTFVFLLRSLFTIQRSCPIQVMYTNSCQQQTTPDISNTTTPII